MRCDGDSFPTPCRLKHPEGSSPAKPDGVGLLALSADIPDAAPPHEDVADLFAAASDDAHALDQFQRGLRLTRNDNRAARAPASGRPLRCSLDELSSAGPSSLVTVWK